MAMCVVRGWLYTTRALRVCCDPLFPPYAQEYAGGWLVSGSVYYVCLHMWVVVLVRSLRRRCSCVAAGGFCNAVQLSGLLFKHASQGTAGADDFSSQLIRTIDSQFRLGPPRTRLETKVPRSDHHLHFRE
jgi:hypothetical protein